MSLLVRSDISLPINMATTESRHGCRGLALQIVTGFFEYDTPKFVHITSKRVGVINRLCQLAIIGYIIGLVYLISFVYNDFSGSVCRRRQQRIFLEKGSGIRNSANLENYWSIFYADS